jgi:hypothetical protein
VVVGVGVGSMVLILSNWFVIWSAIGAATEELKAKIEAAKIDATRIAATPMVRTGLEYCRNL